MGIPWDGGIIRTIDELGATFYQVDKESGDRKSKTFLVDRFPDALEYTLEWFRMQTLSAVIECPALHLQWWALISSL
jgi:hypothetical protein